MESVQKMSENQRNFRQDQPNQPVQIPIASDFQIRLEQHDKRVSSAETNIRNLDTFLHNTQEMVSELQKILKNNEIEEPVKK